MNMNSYTYRDIDELRVTWMVHRLGNRMMGPRPYRVALPLVATFRRGGRGRDNIS